MQFAHIPAAERADPGTAGPASGSAARDDHAPGKGPVQPLFETGGGYLPGGGGTHRGAFRVPGRRAGQPCIGGRGTMPPALPAAPPAVLSGRQVPACPCPGAPPRPESTLFRARTLLSGKSCAKRPGECPGPLCCLHRRQPPCRGKACARSGRFTAGPAPAARPSLLRRCRCLSAKGPAGSGRQGTRPAGSAACCRCRRPHG